MGFGSKKSSPAPATEPQPTFTPQEPTEDKPRDERTMRRAAGRAKPGAHMLDPAGYGGNKKGNMLG